MTKPFTPRAEPQPATKPAKARVEKEKRARPFGPVWTAATEGWRTRPWSFAPRAEQVISSGGPVAEETFGMANDEESVEKALMASSSVAVTENGANSNLATLIAQADFFPGEVRKPLSGGSINAFVRKSTNAFVRGNINAFVRKSINAFVRATLSLHSALGS